MDIREIVNGIASSGALGNAASQAGLEPGQAENALHGVLEHLDANGGSLEGLAETVAARAGISQDQVHAFLPQVLPLLQGHADNAEEGVQSVLNSAIGSLSSGGGLAGLAKSFFGGN